jgi:hypothetical protein
MPSTNAVYCDLVCHPMLEYEGLPDGALVILGLIFCSFQWTQAFRGMEFDGRPNRPPEHSTGSDKPIARLNSPNRNGLQGQSAVPLTLVSIYDSSSFLCDIFHPTAVMACHGRSSAVKYKYTALEAIESPPLQFPHSAKDYSFPSAQS